MKRNLPPIHRGAFSLLELVVTCAVILVLALMLFQLMGGAQRKSNAAKCVANLRQLGVHIQLYANDHNNELVPTLQRTDPNGGTSGITWAEILNKSQILPLQEWSQVKGSVMHCPSRTTRNPRYPNSLPSYNFDGLQYGMSSYPGVSNLIAYGMPRNKLTAIQRPSETVLMTESDWAYLIYPTLTNKRIYPHQGCNLLYVDGHVRLHPGTLPVYGPEKLQPDAVIPPFMGSGG
ncbi:MAG TPA: type II secretion system protein [Chthoniobacteraceae bacterium]|nr:type II secretion system protein [Chthoniobacteraceae bacterium]